MNQAQNAVNTTTTTEISIQEIDVRENALASDTVWCCIVNIAF